LFGDVRWDTLGPTLPLTSGFILDAHLKTSKKILTTTVTRTEPSSVSQAGLSRRRCARWLSVKDPMGRHASTATVPNHTFVNVILDGLARGATNAFNFQVVSTEDATSHLNANVKTVGRE